MKKAVRQAFRDDCVAYLETLSIASLRSYGRQVGVERPTEKQKNELIAEIVSVLLGEKEPVGRATRGAPVKDDFVDPKISSTVNRLLLIYEPADTLQECEERKSRFNATWEDRKKEIGAWKIEVNEYHGDETLFTGHLKTYDGVACLLALNFDLSKPKAVISVEQIRRYDLRDGDVITCRVFVKNSVAYASEILTINGWSVGELTRLKYDDAAVALPYEKICFFDGQTSSLEGKYLDWLLPMGKGQRSLVVGAPKTGKTRFVLNSVKELLHNKPDMDVFVLLIDQAPEVVCEYQKVVDKNKLVATTYTDDDSKHVLAAEFLLGRAQRFAECGRDVLLVFDGLNALAKAYDQTDLCDGGKCLSCGIGSKTLHYVKKYFASAKCLEKKGSFSIMATAAMGTGTPVDDAITAELRSVANHQVVLDNHLALRRIYPAIDIETSQSAYASALFTAEENETEFLFRNRIRPFVAQDFLHTALCSAKSEKEFVQLLQSAFKKL